ncbi:MAG: substrate-binding domain-containing protein [Pseudomonadota bacterium]
MIKVRRQQRILEVLRKEGSVELSELAHVLPGASLVTLRRDLAELAEAGALKRTHGGAVLPDAALAKPSRPDLKVVGADRSADDLSRVDGVILPPISGAGADALRRQFLRRKCPLLAESDMQSGGVYLGPDNAAAGVDLGARTAFDLPADARVLMICQPDLANTSARADGFEAGMRAAQPDISVLRVNGQGRYRQAFRVALDALQADDRITAVFGVNDHSTLGAMDAAARTERKVLAYGMGGESAEFLSRLFDDDVLCAVAVLFPELVGMIGVDLMASAFQGSQWPDVAITPHAVIDQTSLRDFYVEADDSWALKPTAASRLGLALNTPVASPDTKGKVLGFLPHYPAHSWYREMGRVIAERASQYGMDVHIAPPTKGIALELSRLRAEIARDAAQRVLPGHTIILGQGEATEFLALELQHRAVADPDSMAGVTIITNALDILAKFQDPHPFKVILTSGEFQASDNCLVGPSVAAVFDRMRADVAFITAAGVSADFGLSADDERLALVGQRFVNASKHTIALVDHTILGADATHLIARTADFDAIITEDGALPADRQRFRAAGVDVHVAGEAVEDAPQSAEARRARGPRT